MSDSSNPPSAGPVSGRAPSLHADLIGRIRDVFEAPGYQPPVLPSTALEIQALASEAHVDLKKVVELLEKDALLAAEILRIAQSPLYVTRVPPASLHDATIRLGLDTIQRIVWEASLSLRVFRSKRFASAMDSLRRHSATSAHISRLIWSHTNLGPEYAFMCGLLHKVGLAVALIAVEESELEAEPSALRGALEDMYEQTGEWLCRRWNLPTDLVFVVGNHRHVADEPSLSVATVCLAAHLASEAGAPFRLDRNDAGPFAAASEADIESCFAALKIKDRDELVAKAAELAEQLV